MLHQQKSAWQYIHFPSLKVIMGTKTWDAFTDARNACADSDNISEADLQLLDSVLSRRANLHISE